MATCSKTIHWTRTFESARLEYFEGSGTIICRAKTFDGVEEIYRWDSPKERNEARKYITPETKLSIDGTVPSNWGWDYGK